MKQTEIVEAEEIAAAEEEEEDEDKAYFEMWYVSSGTENITHQNCVINVIQYLWSSRFSCQL